MLNFEHMLKCFAAYQWADELEPKDLIHYCISPVLCRSNPTDFVGVTPVKLEKRIGALDPECLQGQVQFVS